MNEYLIKEETLDNIAIQSMNLMGKTEAVSTSTIISDLTSVNSEVATQAELINQIAGILAGKVAGGGNTDIEDALITGTISVYTNDRVTTIERYTFYSCSSLTSVSFPVCINIGSWAFNGCSKLTSVSFPVCTNIGSYAFSGCSKLTSVSFPVCTNIDAFVFDGCKRLTTVSFPVCTNIGFGAFKGCNDLTVVSFPACTNISGTDWSNGAFKECKRLTVVSFPVCTNIGAGTFYYCYNLKSLYLIGSSLCKLSNSNAFYSTPIGGYSASTGTYGSIYVPASLLTQYQTATNWTYFSSRFVAYDSQGDGHMGGGSI